MENDNVEIYIISLNLTQLVFRGCLFLIILFSSFLFSLLCFKLSLVLPLSLSLSLSFGVFNVECAQQVQCGIKVLAVPVQTLECVISFQCHSCLLSFYLKRKRNRKSELSTLSNFLIDFFSFVSNISKIYFQFMSSQYSIGEVAGQKELNILDILESIYGVFIIIRIGQRVQGA